MRSWILYGVAALLALASPSTAWAQGGTEVGVSAEAWYAQRQASDGPAIAIVAVTLDHGPALHSWPSAEQDVLPADLASFAIRTEIALPSGQDGVLGAGRIQWPSPKLAAVPDPAGGTQPYEAPVYAGRAVAFVPVLLDRAATNRELSIEVATMLQACDEAYCYPPQDVAVSVSLPAWNQSAPSPAIADGLDAATLDAAIALAVGGLDAAPQPEDEASVADAPPADGEADAAADPAAPAEVDTRNKFLGVIAVPPPDSVAGVAFIAVLAALGGLVLNLTPCVLPVIPIKVMTLSQHAGTPGKSLVLGLWMALGVVAFWLGIGIPAAVLGTAVGAIFGYWWFTLGVGLIIAVMSIGLMGLFTIQLPQTVYKVNPKVDSPWGSFVFGVMTGVLGLPCFGFVAGALFASSAQIPALVMLVIFAAIGVGMALPYLVLSLNPKWVDVLPRTGPASELVKQVMGLLLLGAAAYFVGTGILALTKDMPWIGGQLQWWAAAVFIAAAGVWLMFKTFQITPKSAPRAAFSLVAIVLGGTAIVFAVDTTSKAKEEYLVRAAALGDASGSLITTTWNDYTPETLQQARDAGYVVVVEFTADWCLNCKALERTVLNVDPVKSRLAADDVIMIKADLTTKSLPGWQLMEQLQQKAPPVLAVYGPGIQGGTPWMRNVYGSEAVLNAIEQAKGQGTELGGDAATPRPGVWDDFTPEKLARARDQG
ncbi:MAG: thioredoxin family protein [Planctomycetota bacterium]